MNSGGSGHAAHVDLLSHAAHMQGSARCLELKDVLKHVPDGVKL